MTTSKPVPPVFHQGDQVIIAKGNNEGAIGVFLRLRPDTNWAEIADRNGNMRSHPVAWLALDKPAAPAGEDS